MGNDDSWFRGPFDWFSLAQIAAIDPLTYRQLMERDMPGQQGRTPAGDAAAKKHDDVIKAAQKAKEAHEAGKHDEAHEHAQSMAAHAEQAKQASEQANK